MPMLKNAPAFLAKLEVYMTLLVLAAGMGSRYGGLKQIDPFTEDGEFIIDFSVFDALQAGFDRVVFIIKEENYEDFRETIGARLEGKVKVEYAFQRMDYLVPADKLPPERTKPWGTTQAILCAQEAVGDDVFAVINADDFYGRDAYNKAAAFLKNTAGKSDNAYAMIGYRLGNTLTDNGSVARGVCMTKDGYLSEIVERTKIYKTTEGGRFEDENGQTIELPADTVVSMNFWCFTPSVFAGAKKYFKEFLENPSRDPLKGECFLPNVVGQMKNDGYCTVEVIETSAKWYGVTYADDKPGVAEQIQAMIADGTYPKGLWK